MTVERKVGKQTRSGVSKYQQLRSEYTSLLMSRRIAVAEIAILFTVNLLSGSWPRLFKVRLKSRTSSGIRCWQLTQLTMLKEKKRSTMKSKAKIMNEAAFLIINTLSYISELPGIYVPKRLQNTLIGLQRAVSTNSLSYRISNSNLDASHSEAARVFKT